MSYIYIPFQLSCLFFHCIYTLKLMHTHICIHFRTLTPAIADSFLKFFYSILFHTTHEAKEGNIEMFNRLESWPQERPYPATYNDRYVNRNEKLSLSRIIYLSWRTTGWNKSKADYSMWIIQTVPTIINLSWLKLLRTNNENHTLV